MTDAFTSVLPPWSGIGADGWDGTVCPDDLRLLSASSAPKALAAPNLERWAITQTVKRIAARLPEFAALVAADMDAAVQWADQLRYEPEAGAELNAADSGTLMHSLLEAWLQGVSPRAEDVAQVHRDPVLKALADNLWQWYCRFQPEPVAMEQVCYWPEAGLAGRFDAIVTFAKAPQFGVTLIDLKNTRSATTEAGNKKQVYGDQHALQLSAYRYATHIATFEPRLLRTQRATNTRTYLLNPREAEVCAPMIQVDSTAIVSNNPERCALYPIDTGPAVRRRLIEAVGVHHWVHTEAKAVVGQPYLPPIDLPVLTPSTGAPA